MGEDSAVGPIQRHANVLVGGHTEMGEVLDATRFLAAQQEPGPIDDSIQLGLDRVCIPVTTDFSPSGYVIAWLPVSCISYPQCM